MVHRSLGLNLLDELCFSMYTTKYYHSLVIAADDITVGHVFVVATLPNANSGGTDRFYLISNGPGTVTLESHNFPTETFPVDVGQVRNQMTLDRLSHTGPT